MSTGASPPAAAAAPPSASAPPSSSTLSSTLSSAPPGSGGSLADLSPADARDYVARVKRALGPSSSSYRDFLSALKGYRSRDLGPAEVIERVSDLFRGRRDLILGFNAFLPGEWRITDPGPGGDGGVMPTNNDNDEGTGGASVDVDGGPEADGKVEAQDPKPSSRKRPRLRVDAEGEVSSGAVTPQGRGDGTGTAAVLSPLTPDAPPAATRNKLDASTKILLSPPTIRPSDLAFPDDRDLPESRSRLVPDLHGVCRLCLGRRDAVVFAREEPILLCERRGCNAEYHLGCLHRHEPPLFPREIRTVDREESADVNDGAPPAAAPAVPEGAIFCSDCHARGAAAVLEKYFDGVEAGRARYACHRARVTALLERHMREHPDGNVEADAAGGGGGGASPSSGDDVRLRPPPRSELWRAEELGRAAEAAGGGGEGAGKDGDRAGPDVRDGKITDNSAEFLVGKPVRLYNVLDNEYHVGRIVDWRRCTIWPPLYNRGSGRSPIVSEDNVVSLEDLEFYGTGPISTSEYLVRFPAGLQGRKRELLRWITLEEHSLAVGVAVVQGRSGKGTPRGGSGGSAGGKWEPAMVLARSSLELVAVRKLLQNFFGEGGGKNATCRDQWALASFFGDERHALLNLRDEVRGLLADSATDSVDNGGDNEARKQMLEVGESAQSSIDIPLALALAEQSEQVRCRKWCRLVLKKSDHEHALVSADEYSMQLKLERKKDGELNTAETIAQPLVERGLDRLFLACLAESVATSASSSSRRQRRSAMSKDHVMGLRCEAVPSVSRAMAILQQR